MFSRRHLSVLALLLIAAPICAQEKDRPWPPLEAAETGMLKVSDRHTLYWEWSGKKDGIPVIVLHGGPGVGSNPAMRGFFDPEIYRIVQFDQRGCGKSTPAPEWRDNTTWDLVQDIEKLRDHLGIEGPAVIWGLSWGTTLGLAYAEAHPEKVSGLILAGVFSGRRREIDHLYHGGAGSFYPESFARLKKVIPNPERLDYHRQLFELISGEDQELARRIAREWAYYEVSMVAVKMTPERAEQIVDHEDNRPFSLLENWYMMNACFLKEGQLLAGAAKIAEIPTWITNGRLDVICPPATAVELAAKLKRVHLDIVPESGHNDRAIFASLIKGSTWIAEQVKESR